MDVTSDVICETGVEENIGNYLVLVIVSEYVRKFSIVVRSAPNKKS